MPLTYNQLYIEIRHLLRDAGIQAYSLEARLIVAYAAGKTKEALLRDFNLYTSDEVEKNAGALLERRLRGEPTAYITGTWEFYGLPLEITRDVLIPRSDSEVIIDTALELMKGKSAAVRILDLCSGSGCLGLALAANLPAARAILLEKSPKAIEVSRRNIRLHDLSSRVVVVEADVMQPPPIRLGSFDLIVSNPPYIADCELDTLDVSVKDYEPVGALDGGEDGHDFYRAILQKWKELLKPGGHIVFEVGERQAHAVEKLMNLNGFLSVNFAKDTAGIDRVVYGKL